MGPHIKIYIMLVAIISIWVKEPWIIIDIPFYASRLERLQIYSVFVSWLLLLVFPLHNPFPHWLVTYNQTSDVEASPLAWLHPAVLGGSGRLTPPVRTIVPQTAACSEPVVSVNHMIIK